MAELGDQHEVYLRLSEFLGSFRSTIKEVRANSRDGGVTLDRMFGDCGEIVHALLDYVDRELGASTSAAASSSRSMSLVELIPEALRAAELILSDERYVAAIKDSAATIGRVLSMLERLQSREARLAAVDLLSRLGSSAEGRRQIGRLQGFAKLLRLALLKDEVLSREVLRTAQLWLERANQPAALAPPEEPSSSASAAAAAADASRPLASIVSCSKRDTR